ncbi:ATP-dependent nuclease [Curtobacterium flaccumfaciens]|uniref:ATP-dependent nuclease n=1 Tax=Curtobacterium flaccumfaciens TaxID=2035 RepID=UPI003D9A543B
MRLNRIDVRFYKSFNFDFELKARPDAQPQSWEDPGPWFPFVKVPLDRDITAIVGANESGKSQLLGAIKAALGHRPIDRDDFCRYSELYSVQVGALRHPEFGAWLTLDEDEEDIAVTALEGVRSFGLFRPGVNDAFLVVDDQRVAMTAEELAAVQERLPQVFEMATDLAIPDSVSIARLAGDARHTFRRAERSSLFDQIDGVERAEGPIAKAITAWLGGSAKAERAAAGEGDDRQFELARKLLVDAAKIAPESFGELRRALASEHEGTVEGLIGRMNDAIKENLNIQRWWTQDKQFDMLVEAREHEIAFTIQDRTASTYSFKERSQGLRFFLSYFVQLTAHRLRNNKGDILLLDEPDAYLSSVGQQDLLRVLHEYAFPEGTAKAGQVVYVTHSPFLIDRNTPERIRVLDKGADDEGTRVVKDAAVNRYEPLRSSLGPYVAETAFIGGQNLFVEGSGDQILLAGISADIARRAGANVGVLDLNAVTIVNCGGADGVPYMVYLARGRDTVKPACVALLDGDEAGVRAARVLRKGEARKQRVLQDQDIVELSTWASSAGIETEWGSIPVEIEDLIPAAVARRAALNNIARFTPLEPAHGADFSAERIIELARTSDSMWKAVSQLVAEVFPDQHIEKTGLAREVIGLLELAPDMEGAEVLRHRFGSLLALLSERLQDAADREGFERSTNQLARQIQSFSRDFTTGMRKHEATRLLRQLAIAAGENDHADSIKLNLARIRRDFEIEDRAMPLVPSFAAFKEQVRALGQLDRLVYQDEVATDPSAAVTVFEPEAESSEGAVSAPTAESDQELTPSKDENVPATGKKTK